MMDGNGQFDGSRSKKGRLLTATSHSNIFSLSFALAMTSSKGHFVAAIDYPVWALAFTGNSDIAVAGGGGAGRSGVKNSLVSQRKEIARNQRDSSDESFPVHILHRRALPEMHAES
jgi:hypothetical protein